MFLIILDQVLHTIHHPELFYMVDGKEEEEEEERLYILTALERGGHHTRVADTLEGEIHTSSCQLSNHLQRN